jgi:hypothetical protein
MEAAAANLHVRTERLPVVWSLPFNYRVSGEVTSARELIISWELKEDSMFEQILAAVSSLKTAGEMLRGIRAAEKSFDEATWKARIAEITVALADGQLALVDAREQLLAKQKEIESLKTALQTTGELVEGPRGHKYLSGVDGKPSGGPVRPRCQPNGQISQMVQRKHVETAQCPVCDFELQPTDIFLPSGQTAAEQRTQQMREAAREANEPRTTGEPYGWMR